MELRTIRYFLAVVDTGSVTAASRRVHVAQPSLSRQLHALEAELGVQLFVREGRRLRLSPVGRRFLPMARDLVARADSARATMTALAHGYQVELAVAAHPTTIADVIAPFVAARGPSTTTPTFVAASADGAYDALGRADVDVAISTNPPPAGAASILLARFPIWAQVLPDHPWAVYEQVELRTLLGRPLILPDRTHGTRRVFDEEVGRSGASYDLAAEVGVPSIGQALAASGAGVAVLTDDPQYGLRRLAIRGESGELHISLHAAWSATHYAQSAIRGVAEALRSFCATVGADGDSG